jgi:hypothetical protein
MEPNEPLESLGDETDRRIRAMLEMMAQHDTTQRSRNERASDVLQGLQLLVAKLDRFADNPQLRMNALAEAQRRTENNLNALISLTEGLVRRPPQ